MITASELQARHDEQGLSPEERLAEVLRLIQAHIVESGLSASHVRMTERERRYAFQQLTRELAEFWFYYAQLAEVAGITTMDSVPPPSRPPRLRIAG